jgi:GNAT superfamily N-acetyltransferase
MTDIVIVRTDDLPPNCVTHLVTESTQAGFRFVCRLVEEWHSGSNQFRLPGEALFLALADEKVVGVCGLNIDPYTKKPGIGRVRRLYVLSAFRGRGIGRRLVEEVIMAARGTFRSLRLRTETAEASRLFSALGFQECAGLPACTHIKELAEETGSDGYP